MPRMTTPPRPAHRAYRRAVRALAILALTLAGFLTTATGASAATACERPNVAGAWVSSQSNAGGIPVYYTFTQSGTTIGGTASFAGIGATVSGTLTGSTLTFTVSYSNGATGRYTGTVTPTSISGTAVQLSPPPNITVSWSATGKAKCGDGTIQGRVVQSICGRNGCSQKGLAGVTVAAKGTGGGSARTKADGRYSLDVAAGSYTVTPTRGAADFDPVSKRVSVAAGKTASADFSTCASGQTSNARETARAGCVTISGRITRFVCPDRGPCTDVLVAPAPSRAVQVTGPTGVVETETDANGDYEVAVARGRNVVRVPGPANSVKPVTTAVSVGATSVQDVDFHLCKVPAAARLSRPPGCAIVRIEGTAFDLDGTPFPRVALATDEGGTLTDAQGRFTLHHTAGSVGIDVRERSIPTNTVTLNARRDIVGARITVKPAIAFSQTAPSSITVLGIAGVPVVDRGILGLTLARTVDDLSGCRFRQTAELTSGPQTNVILTPTGGFSAFCPGDWTAAVAGSTGRTLAVTPFRVG